MKYLLILLFIVSSVQAFSASWSIRWDRNTEANISGYRVYIGTSPRTYTRWENAGTNVTHTVTNLSAGTTYYFAVTAINSFGQESGFSNEAVTPSGPSSPVGLQVIGFTNAVIDWRGITNRAGLVTPVMIVQSFDGLSIKGTIDTPAGKNTRAAVVSGGKAEFAGRPNVLPFTAVGDVALVAIDPNMTSTKLFK